MNTAGMVTVSDLAKEIGVSESDLLRDLKACNILSRSGSAYLTPVEVRMMKEFYDTRKQSGEISAQRPGQTKRRVLVHVSSGSGRRGTIKVEIRKRRPVASSPAAASVAESVPADELLNKNREEASLVSQGVASGEGGGTPAETSEATHEQWADRTTQPQTHGREAAVEPEPPVEGKQRLAEGPSSREEEASADAPSGSLEVEGSSLLHDGAPDEPEEPLSDEEVPARPAGRGLERSNFHAGKGGANHKVVKKSDPKPGRKPKGASPSSYQKFESKPQKKTSLLGKAALEPWAEEEGEAEVRFRTGKPSAGGKGKSGGGSGKRQKGTKTGGFPSQPSVHSELKQKFQRPVAPVARVVKVHEGVTVSELAEKFAIKGNLLIKELIKLGVMATLNQVLELDVVQLLGEALGHEVICVSEDSFREEWEKREEHAQVLESQPRPPVVTVMGHVNHGKTSLLDYIRSTKVAEKETGGITQHLGAYVVSGPSGEIVFLDTPGHAAFSAMRARGAQITDIVILVVSGEEGVMPQTVEAIQHAKAASVPMVVAVTKKDRPGFDPTKVKEGLLSQEVVVEEWGGETQMVEVSAKSGEGVDALLEAVLLQAELLNLRAVVEGAVRGVVLESRLEKGRGSVATILVQRGKLERGSYLVCGQTFGKVRALESPSGGAPLACATASTPVLVYGLSGLPLPGEQVYGVENEKLAREVAENFKSRARLAQFAQEQGAKKANSWNAEGESESTAVSVVLKADTHGSLEALKASIETLNRVKEVDIRLMGYGVGGITESDVSLALATQALLIGFKVRPDLTARQMIERHRVQVTYPGVIYEALEELKSRVTSSLPPLQEQIFRGLADVRAVFRSPKFGQVAGCFILEGMVERKLPVRVLRDNCVIFEGSLSSLRRGKEDVQEVRQGYECGIGIRHYSDVQVGDKIEVYEIRKVARDPFSASSKQPVMGETKGEA